MKRTGTIPSVPNSISFSPDGASVAISHGVAGNILVFNLADRKSAVPLNHGAMTRTLAWTDDGQHLLTGGLGSLKTWEFADESAGFRPATGGRARDELRGSIRIEPKWPLHCRPEQRGAER